MKNTLFLVLISVIFSQFISAQTEIASDINAIKVFKRNAQISRDISFTATNGTQEIILTGISTKIIPSSLQIQLNNTNATLLSAKYEKNYLLSNTNNKQAENFQKQLDDLNEELSVIEDKKNSLKGMEDILNKNQDLGDGAANFTAQQVVQLSNSYQTKYLEIRKSLRVLLKQEKPLQEKIAKINNQLNEVNAKFNRPSGSIILRIAATASKLTKINCKYIVNNAGWNPTYDIRSESITENAHLNYKANLYQNTGIDWKNVAITVSTGNPSQNNNRPILSPLYANIYQAYNLGYEDEIEEVVVEEVAMSNMALKKTAGVALEPSIVAENQLSVDFVITSKQTIHSDGKENVVALKNYELTTEYIYHSVPKLNKATFLLAKISDWSTYNLVAGTANIFFQGGFVGTSQINPQVTSDSLLISMGVDNGIIIERLPIEQFTSSKFIGANKTESIGYEFIIKNKKSVSIKIEILDQIPVTQNKDIQVTLDKKGNAEYTKDIGKLLWTMDIEAKQTKKEKFIYTVKYPKKESLTGIK